MAREVKCRYCNELFDRDKVEWVKTSNGRYAHKTCDDKYQKKIQEQEDKKKYKALIHQKMKDVCGNTYIKTKVEKQIKSYVENGISEREIYNTLIYWYDVKQNSPADAKGGIGIVPYVHVDASKYMKTKYKREHRYDNIDKDALQKEIEERDRPKEITMVAPQIKPPKRKHYFNLE